MGDGKRSTKNAIKMAKWQYRLERRKARKPFTTMKWVVLFSLLNGYAWVWCSYILAFMDKYTIAEQLSQVAITEIIGVVLVYALKSLVENLSKNNQWPDKPWKGEQAPKDEAATVETESGVEVEMAEDANVSALDYINTDTSETS